MRKVCIDSVHQMAKANKDIVFVGSDLGVGVLADMKKELPDQFLMEGVSEQHIIGLCAGLAMSGKVVYTNTIATFLTRRCYEQIVIDLALTKARVRLLGSGGGIVYAPLGPTHLAFEDIAIMRAIPNMAIVAAADAEEMSRLMRVSADYPGPIYIRIAKGGDEVVSRKELGFEIGRAVVYEEPGDVLFVTTGIMLQRAMRARRILEAEGLKVGIVHAHTVKPLDAETILGAVRKAKAVLTLEEHTVVGGLGSAVAELIAENADSRPRAFKRIGLPDAFPDDYGNQDSLMKRYGLDPESLAAQARRLCGAVEVAAA